MLSVNGIPSIVPGATSSDTGAFRLPIVPREASSLVAIARGYRAAHVALVGREDDVELAVVGIKLLAAAPVAGDVRDPDGKPVRARVVACEGESTEARVESGDDGTFELPASAIGCNAMAEHAAFEASASQHVVDGHRLLLRLGAGGLD